MERVEGNFEVDGVVGSGGLDVVVIVEYRVLHVRSDIDTGLPVAESAMETLKRDIRWREH